MRRILALAVLAYFPASAQILDISTDFTGANLVFWTRFRLQTETDSDIQQKVYKWHDGQWSRLVRFDPPQNAFTDAVINQPFVVASGAIYGWNVIPGSIGHFPQVRVESSETLFGLTVPEGFKTEYFRVSPNGRYAVGGSFGTILNELHWSGEFLDVQTAKRVPLPRESSYPSVADDGTLAFAVTTSRLTAVKVVAPGHRPQLFHVDGSPQELAISPNGQWIGVELTRGDERALRILSTSTGDSFEVPVQRGTYNFVEWRISNTRAVYFSPDSKQLLTVDLATRKTSVLAESAELFSQTALSGDGNVAWAVTNTNRLIRIDTLGGSQTDVLPPLAAYNVYGNIPSIRGLTAKGSAALVPGQFAKEEQVTLNGQPVTLSMLSDDGFWFQTPWDYNGPASLPVIVRTPGNPFESIYKGFQGDLIYGYNFPYRQTGNQYVPMVLHEDFSGYVSSDRPARAGEMLHAYMTGLGPLERPVPTGMPGPKDPDPPIRPLVCGGRAVGQNQPPPFRPVEVSSVLFAPDLIGFYQVDLKVPSDVPNGNWELRCGPTGLTEGASAFISTHP